MKQIKNLGEKEVILCTTIEECEAIAGLLDNEGFTWNCGTPYLDKPFWKKSYREKYDVKDFCFCPKEGTFDDLVVFKDCDYVIHDAKDFLQETPKQVSNEVKEELQDILNEWERGKFQIPLNVIIRQRLK